MTIWDVLTFVLGLALFLFGMNVMGNALKKSAGHKLKRFLSKLTSGRWRGFLLGMTVTAVIQSSSAATVMTVGLVNSGAMLLSQSVGVIMGANVGTAITSWLTALSGLESGGGVSSVLRWLTPAAFTPILALVGLFFYMIGKNDRKKNIGMILLGFSVLMLGMDTMSDAMSEFGRSEKIGSLFLWLENPLLGLAAGMIVTAIIQSSSASIGILQALTVTGSVTFGNAVPIIMGQNIGTCVTTLLASAGAGKNAKRVAAVHVFFNVFGAGICMTVFYLLKYAVKVSFLNGSVDMWGIAAIHTLFNLITATVLFPLAEPMERLATATVKGKEEDDPAEGLEMRLLATPSVAVERSYTVAEDMASCSVSALHAACGLIAEGYNDSKAKTIREQEARTDRYEDKLGSYLMQISENGVLDKEERKVLALWHTLSDWERISDHAVHLTEAAEELSEKEIHFSAEGNAELAQLTSAVCEITSLTLAVLQEQDCRKAEWVEPLKTVICQLKKEIKNRHILRLQDGNGTIEEGFILNDILTDLERVADHCSNIAGCFMEQLRGNGLELHRSLKEYRGDRAVFDGRQQMYAQKYQL